MKAHSSRSTRDGRLSTQTGNRFLVYWQMVCIHSALERMDQPIFRVGILRFVRPHHRSQWRVSKTLPFFVQAIRGQEIDQRGGTISRSCFQNWNGKYCNCHVKHYKPVSFERTLQLGTSSIDEFYFSTQADVWAWIIKIKIHLRPFDGRLEIRIAT